MAENPTHISYRPLRTPKAAGFAGIGFAVLQITSYYLMQSSIPAETLYEQGNLDQLVNSMSFALSLLPFAGIAFLWFLGVLRDRLGHMEDQFFSTLFFGSGYLYLGTTFVAAALAGRALVLYASDPDLSVAGHVGLTVFGDDLRHAEVHELHLHLA